MAPRHLLNPPVLPASDQEAVRLMNEIHTNLMDLSERLRLGESPPRVKREDVIKFLETPFWTFVNVVRCARLSGGQRAFCDQFRRGAAGWADLEEAHACISALKPYRGQSRW